MKILLAEDTLENRDIISKFLTKLGHDVTACENGQKAWEKLQENYYHLVLSDIQMPVMNGHQLLEKIKKSEKYSETLVVLFTGYRDVKSAITAMRIGAYDYLLKPINIEELAILTDRVNDYLSLRKEHHELTHQFDETVGRATEDLKYKLKDTQSALARLVGTEHIGVFSEKMQNVIDTAKRLRTNPDLPVLVVGDTGTGKELLARYIHFGEGDNAAPFVAINCAAINPNVFESELFGYEAGAFTGGNPKGQPGKLELAKGGTLFLDEITEMGLELQAKLLRVLQEREFYRVGGLKKLKTEVRIIGATNRNIEGIVEEGLFRRDLYYRLNVGMLKVPSIDGRPEEIIPLAQLFLNEHKENNRTHFENISKEAEEILNSYDWPGNVREIKNAIERIVLLYDDTVVKKEHLDFLPVNCNSSSGSVKSVSLTNSSSLPDDELDLNAHILDIVELALEKFNGNRTKTSNYLGITRSMLYTYMKHLE